MKKKDRLIKVAIDKWITTQSVTLNNGKRIDVSDLIKHCKDNLIPFKMDINKITGVYRSPRTGFSKKRYENTDLKYPVILDEKLDLVDGRHRTLKARDLGKKTLRAYIVDTKILENKIKSAKKVS